jgi:hypothetical protein
MNSSIIYNLRNRAVYSTVFTSFLEGIESFLENYKEFLTEEHSLLLHFLKKSTLIEGEHVKSIFRVLLNFVEIQFESSKKNKYYLERHESIPLNNLLLLNESIYCLRVNYLRMKRDLYQLYKVHVDPLNVHINKFLDSFKLIKHNIDVEYDDAQIMLDNNAVFGI